MSSTLTVSLTRFLLSLAESFLLGNQANTPLTIDAFDLLKVIGKGSFGKVRLTRLI